MDEIKVFRGMLLRCWVYLTAKTQKQERSQTKKKLDVGELKNAEKTIVRYAHSQAYVDEIQSLRNPEAGVKNSSKIWI